MNVENKIPQACGIVDRDVIKLRQDLGTTSAMEILQCSGRLEVLANFVNKRSGAKLE